MYIISPISIYLLGLVDNLQSILGIGSVALFFLGLFCYSEISDLESSQFRDKYMKATKICLIVSTIMAIIWVFIPTKETIIQMLIAKNITVDRVQIAGDIVEKVYSDIINILNK